MKVVFFYNGSDDRVINKTLVGGEEFEGQARDEVDVMSPRILFDTPNIMRYNYAYIPEFERYYFVNPPTAFREGLWEVVFSVDVLMSFRGDIMTFSVIVDKQSMAENGDEYIDDGSLVTDNVMFTRIHQFETGFNDCPEYVLITAG